MAQRTGRRVKDAAHLPAHGKKAAQMNATQPGVPQSARLGDGSSTDCSHGNDGSKPAKAAPKGAHKGPDRTK